MAERLEREELDVTVQVRSRHRVYAGQHTSELRTFGVVGLRDDATGEYLLYLTNIGCEALAPHDIAGTYAVRWEIELLFKELKSSYRVDQIPSCKRHVVEAMLYAALLTLAASRALLCALREAARPGWLLPTRRWSALMVQHAQDFLLAVAAGQEDPDLVALLLHEARDPNRRRLHLLQSAERGLHTYDPRPRHRNPSRNAAQPITDPVRINSAKTNGSRSGPGPQADPDSSTRHRSFPEQRAFGAPRRGARMGHGEP